MKIKWIILLGFFPISAVGQTVWNNVSGGYHDDSNGNYKNSICLGQGSAASFQQSDYCLTPGFLQPSSSPKILASQASNIVCRGSSLTLAFSCKGGGTLHYQWKKNNVDIPGATDSLYHIINAQYTDSGLYQCKVYNNVGYVLTPNMKVSVKSLPNVSLADFNPVCSNDAPFLLLNGNPAGGVYNGTGVISGFFYPSVAGLGSYPVTYTYTDPSKCVASLTKNIEVKTTTVASIGTYGDMCINDDPLLLSSGTPEGGRYEGPGIAAGQFYPILSGAGSQTIRYIYTDQQLCSDTAQTNILVKNVTPAVLNSFQDVCLNQSAFLLTGGSPAGGEYSGSGVSGSVFSPEIAGVGQHSIFYTFKNPEGCESYTSKKIRVLELPEFNLGEDILLCDQHAVSLKGPAGFQKYEWSHKPDSNTVSIILPDTGLYSLRITGNNNCTFMDSLEVKMFHPFEQEEICLVTVNRLGKNMVIWEKTPGKGTAGYNIYRESVNYGKYDLIGSVPYDRLSVFTDTSANPRKRAYQYKIQVMDTCGHPSAQSYYHRTMLLKVSKIVDGINLDWTARYEYEGGGFTFSKFYIYRGSSPDNLAIIDSIGPNYYTYTDDKPLPGKTYYQIGGLKAGGCFPTGSLKSGENVQIVLSNFEDNGIVGIESHEDNGLVIYPNPFWYEARVEFYNPSGQAFEAFIRDVTGKTVRTIGKITGNSFVIERENLVSGTYLLELRGKEILRGKLIVQ
jgi:hypothetical protein